jgi:transcription elongation factor Elf1
MFYKNPEWVECPGCHMGYKTTALGVSFNDSKQYTVMCTNCRTAFDVDVTPGTMMKKSIVSVTKRV